jgi:hypothetical protein
MFDLPSPIDPPGMTPQAMLEAIAECETRVRAAQARQLELIAGFAASQREEFANDDPDIVERAVGMEVGAAVGASIGSGRLLAADADVLTAAPPAVLDALKSGRIGMFAARQIVAATRAVPCEIAAALDAELAEEAAELLPGQVRSAAEARLAAADPTAAARRAELARADKRVWFQPQPDAVARIGATLPAEQALACWHALDDYARGRRADGDQRTIDEIMSDTFVERITGAIRAERSYEVELQLVMTDRSLFGQAEAPADLSGYGAVPADLARRLSTEPKASVWVRRLLTDPIDATMMTIDTKRRRFAGPVRELIMIRDRRCRNPRCDAQIRDADHRVDWAGNGSTSAANGDGYCQRCHHLKDHSGIAVNRLPALPGEPDAHKITWTGPSGKTYASLAPPALGHGSLTLHQISHRRALARAHDEPD